MLIKNPSVNVLVKKIIMYVLYTLICVEWIKLKGKEARFKIVIQYNWLLFINITIENINNY